MGKRFSSVVIRVPTNVKAYVSIFLTQISQISQIIGSLWNLWKSVRSVRDKIQWEIKISSVVIRVPTNVKAYVSIFLTQISQISQIISSL